MKRRSLVTKGPGRTIALGRNLGRSLVRGDVVLLYGALGSGKTVLVKGICEGLKVMGTVKSPSFVVVNEYEGVLPVFHIDLYRLSRKEVGELRLDEYFDDDGVTCVEWADHLPRIPRGTALKIRLRHAGSRARRVFIYDFRN